MGRTDGDEGREGLVVSISWRKETNVSLSLYGFTKRGEGGRTPPPNSFLKYRQIEEQRYINCYSVYDCRVSIVAQFSL